MTKLDLEDKIMGRKEPLPKTELQLKAFTAETKYIVYAEGNNNKKTVTGLTVKNILSLDNRELITNGELVVRANGLVIERVVEEVTEEISETDEEISVVEKPKPKRKRAK